MKCNYCESEGECIMECMCAKCLNPEEYEEWKNSCPEDHQAWVENEKIIQGEY